MMITNRMPGLALNLDYCRPNGYIRRLIELVELAERVGLTAEYEFGGGGCDLAVITTVTGRTLSVDDWNDSDAYSIGIWRDYDAYELGMMEGDAASLGYVAVPFAEPDALGRMIALADAAAMVADARPSYGGA